MDSHFEVILERVKQLTEKSGDVVWFEIPDTVRNHLILILINEKSRIGMIKVTNTRNDSELVGYKLKKPQYDDLTDHRFSLDSIEQNELKPFDTAKLVKWVSGS